MLTADSLKSTRLLTDTEQLSKFILYGKHLPGRNLVRTGAPSL